MRIAALFVQAALFLGDKSSLVHAKTGGHGGGKKCNCKKVGDSFIVTRLWNIVDDGLTDQDVIDEFNEGFSPIVRGLEGFQEYTSAATGDDDTVFFFNIFETPELASAAQSAAVDFVKGTDALKDGAITPNQFTEAEMSFFFSSKNCVKRSIKGKYLSTRLWKLTDGSSFDIQGVADEFEMGYAPIVTAADGFLEYGGAPVTGTDTIFFYNVFETAEGAAAANAGAASFVNDGALSGNIEKVVFTEGLVGFDYSCVNPVKY